VSEWTEEEYRLTLEHERHMYAWCLVRHGGLAPDAAEKKAAAFYEYEPPENDQRGLRFHDEAWHWALLHLFDKYWIEDRELERASSEYRAESDRFHARQGDQRVHILTSEVMPREGFVHGFPDRWGGVSTGKRASLNLGYRWGDDPENVAENRRRVAAAAGYDPARLQVTKHVHGTRVWVVGDPAPDPPEFDVLATDRAGDVLGAFAADCLPILFADPVARACAAAHAGWRGTAAGVAPIAVRALADRFGSRAADVRVALGPSIGPCCFEVGDEVVDAFRAALGDVPGMIADGPRKKHIDLRVATRVQLERAGVRPELIDDRPPCTRCRGDRFFSFRRDGLEGGVHMGFVGVVAGPSPR
jgi:YfiH family protein